MAHTDKPKKAIHWCLTINNYDNNTFDQFEHPDIKYFVAGFEVGESGTKHIQGYVAMKSQKYMTAMKKIFPTAHLEVKRGTIDGAIKYCMKDGNFVEHGERPEEQQVKGGRAMAEKYKMLSDLAMQGKLSEIQEVAPVEHTRFYHTYKAMARDNMIKPNDLEDVCGEWYYGEAGSGKTTKARMENPGAYIKSRDKWWDGYREHEVVILDDLDKFNVSLGGSLKDWSDKWTFKAETKGGYMWIRPKKFIVTSQYGIDQIFEDVETREALHRRFHGIHFIKDRNYKAKRVKVDGAEVDYDEFVNSKN